MTALRELGRRVEDFCDREEREPNRVRMGLEFADGIFAELPSNIQRAAWDAVRDDTPHPLHGTIVNGMMVYVSDGPLMIASTAT